MVENQESKKGRMNIKKSTQALAILAILMAAQVVLGMFEVFHSDTVKLTLSFIPVVIAARLYGSVGGIVVAGFGDIISYLIHPVGAWVPQITLTYAFIGAIYGLFLHKKVSMVRITIAVLTAQCVVSLFVTTLWLTMLGSTENTLFWELYWTKVGMRLLQVVVMSVVQLVIIPFILKAVDRIPFIKCITER